MSGTFDIVIPVGPYDKLCIYKQIEYTKKNVIGYRNIYIISYFSKHMIFRNNNSHSNHTILFLLYHIL